MTWDAAKVMYEGELRILNAHIVKEKCKTK